MFASHHELDPRGHHDGPEGERVGADGGHHDGGDVGVDHGGSGCGCIGCAACGRGHDHTWRTQRGHYVFIISTGRQKLGVT